MKTILTFGSWLKRRRGGLGLTQKELAQQVGYAEVTLRKVEADELRPSRQMAEKLAHALQLALEDQAQFVRFARDQPGWDEVSLPTQMSPAALSSPPTNLLPQLVSCIDREHHNLPTPPTLLIGRTVEISTAIALLRRDDTWLVTLSGPGGSGKTRLGLEIAGMLIPYFPHGIFFVDLTPIQDPALLLPTIIEALGLQETPGQSIEENLQFYLRDKQILLILDNFEQLVAAAPRLADLHRRAPRLTLLVTSRTLLRLRGEKELLVLPLPLPESVETLETVKQSEAVRLFVERVQDVQPNFALTENNAPTLAAICIHLDGLPLAIELAAVHCKVLSLQKLLEQLAHPLDLLTQGFRDLPDRQQTLRATIAWSYHLLNKAEQALCRRLAVFVGGCTLEAAEAVWAERGLLADRGLPASAHQRHNLYLPGPLLDEMAALVDKNLVQQSIQFDEPRFRMLETIREYAWEQLCTQGEEAATQRLHVEYYLQLAEQAAAHLRSPDQAAWLEQLAVEYGNLRAAVAWTLGNQQADTGARLGTALWRFWNMRGFYAEGWHWLEQLLHLIDDPAQRANLLYGQGMLAQRRGENEQTFDCFSQSLLLYRQLADTHGIASALRSLGFVCYQRGDFERARSILEEALLLFRTLDDQEGVAVTLDHLAHIAFGLEEAKQLYEESLALLRHAGNLQDITVTLGRLAYIAIDQTNYEKAHAYLDEQLQISETLGNRNGIATALCIMGYLAYAEQDFAAAQPLYEKSMKLCQEIGDRSQLPEPIMWLGALALIRNQQAEAHSHLEQALLLYQSGNNLRRMSTVLGYLAALEARQGNAQRAVLLLGASQGLDMTVYRTTSEAVPYLQFEEAENTPAQVRAWQQLGEEVATQIWEAGLKMTPTEAVAYALGQAPI